MPAPPGPAVVVDSLVKEFKGGVRALDGVSFEIPAGTVLGLLGPNGAGKTTAVRVLTTLLRPDSGTLTWPASTCSPIPPPSARSSDWPASTRRSTRV